MRITALTILCCSILGIVPVAAADTRDPKPLERAYVGFALDQENHEICARISPRALERAPFNSPGTRKYHTRSACFLYLAHRTLNPYFCREVHDAKSWLLLSGEYFSRENCEHLVSKGASLRAHIGFDHEIVLRALGYSESDLNGQDWFEFYHGFFRRNDGSLQHRIKDLPDFSAE